MVQENLVLRGQKGLGGRIVYRHKSSDTLSTDGPGEQLFLWRDPEKRLLEKKE